jgi:hypothetical protein
VPRGLGVIVPAKAQLPVLPVTLPLAFTVADSACALKGGPKRPTPL